MARRSSDPSVATSFSSSGHSKMKDFGFSGSLEGSRGVMAPAASAKGVQPAAKHGVAPGKQMPMTHQSGHLSAPKMGGKAAFAKGGHVSAENCYADGGAVEPDMTQELARGGRAGMHRGRKGKMMKPKMAPMRAQGALTTDSALNRPPRNPETMPSDPNQMPGGEMGYGVQPSSEPDNAGSEQGIPQLKRGGKVRRK